MHAESREKHEPEGEGGVARQSTIEASHKSAYMGEKKSRPFQLLFILNKYTLKSLNSHFNKRKS